MSSEKTAGEPVALQAARWFAKLNGASISTADLMAFRAWRSEPVNALAYETVAEAWTAAAVLGGDVEIQAMISKSLTKTKRSKAIRRALAAAGGPVAAMALIGAAVVLRPVVLGDSYQTASGQQQRIVLGDGSTVRLDADSRMLVRLTPWRRSVALTKGRAFFDVVHKKGRPFDVEAGSVVVHDLGTQFQVQRSGSGVEVSLLQGEVQVTSRAQASKVWNLHPGQAWSSASGRPPHPADVVKAVRWAGDVFMLDGRSLAAVVAEFNRHNRRQIILDAAQGERMTMGGAMQLDDPEDFANAIASLYDLDLKTASNGDLILTAPVTNGAQPPSETRPRPSPDPSRL